MNFRSKDEQIPFLMDVIGKPTPKWVRKEAKQILKSVIAKRPYRRMVFITPGGATNNTTLLFRSIHAAAHYLANCTNEAWCKEQEKVFPDKYRVMKNINNLIRNRTKDEYWNDEWWMADEGDEDHITNMQAYNIADMRHYNPK